MAKHKNNNLINKFVICPYCGCEMWHIRANHIQCFLCKGLFSPKELIAGSNIYSINKNLKFLRDVSDFHNYLESDDE